MRYLKLIHFKNAFGNNNFLTIFHIQFDEEK